MGKKVFMYLILGFLCNLLIYKRLYSQSIQTDTLKVYGNCGMCKARIEKAVIRKGVISAKWNPENQLLIVKYKPKVVSRAEIEQRILQVGHDLENQKAPDEIYEKLHNCCRYRKTGNN